MFHAATKARLRAHSVRIGWSSLPATKIRRLQERTNRAGLLDRPPHITVALKLLLQKSLIQSCNSAVTSASTKDFIGLARATRAQQRSCLIVDAGTTRLPIGSK